jgi:hypothetical protein
MPTYNAQQIEQPQDTAKQHDGLLHLSRSLNNVHPDKFIGGGNGILGAGMPGSGKTTLLARLLEQFGFCGFPFSAFDLEGDLASLIGFVPRGVLATKTNCPTVAEMYEEGLQVVFDLASWGKDMDGIATLLTTMVNGLIDHAHALPRNLRVPFLVALDEAAYWLPQTIRGRTYLEPEQFKEIFTAFHDLTLRGRKMGMVPLLFTQRFADVHKDVLTTMGTHILMKQTIDTELKRYLEYINTAAFGEDDLTDKQIKARIAAFKPGQAVIKLPSGKQGVVQFFNRESEHISHAPKTVAALNAYRNVRFDPSRRYGAFLAHEEMSMQASNTPAPVELSPSTKATKNAALSRKTSVVETRIRALLRENPGASPTQIAPAAHCSYSKAKQWIEKIKKEG